MITIQQIQKEIETIKTQIKQEELKKAQENRLRKRIQLLRECGRYIESNPKEDFIKAQLAMTENKINLRMKGFDESKYKDWNKSELNKVKRAYEKEFDIPKLRGQASAMRLILNN